MSDVVKHWSKAFAWMLALDLVLTTAISCWLICTAHTQFERQARAIAAAPKQSAAASTGTATQQPATAQSAALNSAPAPSPQVPAPAAPPQQGALSQSITLAAMAFTITIVASVVSGLILLCAGIATIVCRIGAMPTTATTTPRLADWGEAYRGALLLCLLGALLIVIPVFAFVGRL